MTWARGPSTAKYGNERLVCSRGHSHRSKLESAVCQITALRERAGELKLVGTEVTIRLSAARIVYIVDFQAELVATGTPLYIEAKGFETPGWRIKRRLWVPYGPGPLEVWSGSHVKPMLKETIVPEWRKAE